MYVGLKILKTVPISMDGCRAKNIKTFPNTASQNLIMRGLEGTFSNPLLMNVQVVCLLHPVQVQAPLHCSDEQDRRC